MTVRRNTTRHLHRPGVRVAQAGIYECAVCRRNGKTFQTCLPIGSAYPPCPGCRENARWRKAETTG